MCKARPADSFFNFFSPPDPPPDDAVESGVLDEEELEEIEDRLGVDYQIGEDIKERVSSIVCAVDLCCVLSLLIRSSLVLLISLLARRSNTRNLKMRMMSLKMRKTMKMKMSLR